jgi:uncharacterized protein YjbJ (UPF0337 family)
VGIGDQTQNKAEELKGLAEEAAGRVTGDEDLEAQGQADQAKANLKQAAQRVKDAVAPAGEDVKEAASDAVRGAKKAAAGAVEDIGQAAGKAGSRREGKSDTDS